jgi:hypothetical protein
MGGRWLQCRKGHDNLRTGDFVTYASTVERKIEIGSSCSSIYSISAETLKLFLLCLIKF